MTHPIIGRYAPMPTQTLRQMPRHWTLEETRKDQGWHWWRDQDFWVGVIIFALGLFVSLGVLAQII